MIHEVEAKVRLTPADVNRLRAALKKKATFYGRVLKADVYYESGLHTTLRLRKETLLESPAGRRPKSVGPKTRVTLDIKKRALKNRVEVNREWSWPVAHFQKAQRLLKNLGLRETLKKQKDCRKYLYRGATIELNHVKTLGNFLEVEILIKDPQKIPATHQKIRRLIAALGFSAHAIESQPYAKLLT